MVHQFTFNLFFIYLYMHIVDVNKDVSSAFLFCVLRPAEHETMRPQPQRSSFWQMFWLLHWKHELKLQILAKQLCPMKASELFRNFPETPDFDHSNYRLFERITAVPGTSNNRDLTVFTNTTGYFWSLKSNLNLIPKCHKLTHILFIRINMKDDPEWNPD